MLATVQTVARELVQLPKMGSHIVQPSGPPAAALCLSQLYAGAGPASPGDERSESFGW